MGWFYVEDYFDSHAARRGCVESGEELEFEIY